MFKKLLAGLALALTISTIAQAGLVKGTFLTDGDTVENGSFQISNGLSKWSRTDLFLIQHDPGVVSGQTGDFNYDPVGGAGLFDNFAHLITGLGQLSTSGNGQLSYSTFWSIGAGADIMNVSFLGNYVIDLFTDELFRASGEGVLTYGTQTVDMSFLSEASNNGVSASISNTFNVLDMGSVIPPAVSVDESASWGNLAIALLLMMLFVSKRKEEEGESGLMA